MSKYSTNNFYYTYSFLMKKIASFKKSFPFLKIGTIGSSVLGNSIPYVKIGIGKKQVFYCASFHANEWITTPVLMKFIEHYSKAYKFNSSIYGYSARTIFNTSSLYIVPMVNPDGVNLVTGSISQTSSEYQYAKKISTKYSDIPFPAGWKANIYGVDLNLQFPAGWQQAKKIKFSKGFNSPAPRDFVGYKPLEAPEAIAIYNFTLSHNFDMVLTYHTQGKEIYWNFQNYEPSKSKKIGEIFANISGYILAEVPYNSSFAGYKDWFIQNFRKPGYTIEAGLGENPLPISQFNEIYNDNIGILVLGAVL